MEVSHNFDLKLTPLLSGRGPEALRRCPKCSSLFISDEACDSCGYQLAYDALGAPFSERSYYALSETFYHEQPLLFRLYPALVEHNLKRALRRPKRYPKEVKFMGRLAQRFQTLSKYFLSTDKYDISDRKLYLLEWRELCLNLLGHYGEAWVSAKLDELIFEHTKVSKVNLLMGFYSRALEEFRRGPQDQGKQRFFKPKGLNYFGLLILIFIASVSALGLMKYFTLMGR